MLMWFVEWVTTKLDDPDCTVTIESRWTYKYVDLGGEG